MQNDTNEQPQPQTTPPSGPTPNPEPSPWPASEPTEATRPVDISSEPTGQAQPTYPEVVPVTPVEQTPQKPANKKKIMIAGIITGVLVLLGGVGAAAYNVWYQNPDKVLSDAVMNAVQAKSLAYEGEFTIDTKGKDAEAIDSLTLTIDGKGNGTVNEVNMKLGFTYAKKDFSLSGTGMYDKDSNLYFKVNNVRKLIDSVFTGNSSLPEAFDDIIDKVDGKWVKVSAEDLKEISRDTAKTQECTTNAFKKLQEDKSVGKEIGDLYKKNKFVIVTEKLGSDDGSLGYVIDGDKAKAKSFDKGFKDTTLYKDLKKCDADFDSSASSLFTDDSSDNTDSKTRVAVWISRWSHQLTKVELDGSDKEMEAKLVFEPTFNEPVTVSVPKDFITMDELKEDIEKAQNAYIMSALGDMEPSSARSNSTEL